MKQTESNSREEKTAKFVHKTFFFASEAIKGEKNTYNTREFFEFIKKFSSIIIFATEKLLKKQKAMKM